MSWVFSDTSGKDGIIQRIEDRLNFDDGRITDNATLLAKFTAKVNAGQNKAWSIIIPASGTWQWDDSNHTKYPIIKTNLVSGQRDYSFTVDEQSNLILDIYKVAILSSSSDTTYDEIAPFDELDSPNNDIVSEASGSGVPDRYGKLANGIFLDPKPSYSATNGLKIFINREGSYFATSDTTKTPGFAGIFHDYLVLYACYEYAVDNNLSNVNGFYEAMLRMEKEMEKYYGKRERDVVDVLIPEPIIHI